MSYSCFSRFVFLFTVLIYLGIVALGAGYFAWNKGVTLVNVGVLAVMNNLLFRAGIWNHDADILRLGWGAAIILIALILNQWLNKKRHSLIVTE